MIKVGITGGIGSGKSHICELFARLKVPVFNADDESRKLSDSDPDIITSMTSMFGKEIYIQQHLNRPLLAEYIFKNKQLLDQVNKIIHPKVAGRFVRWCDQYVNYPYVIQESAILLESKAYRSFDKIITVTSPVDLRIKRVITRKNMNMEKIKAIMNNQMPEKEMVLFSDYIIINDDTKLVIPQVLQLHQTFTTGS